MLVDDFLPVYDVSDSVATVVNADLTTTWDALMEVDLIDVGRKRPLIGVLGAIRTLPDIVSHLLHGELPQGAPKQMRLRDMATIPMTNGGWVLLGERPHDEIALALVGKFWRPVIEFAAVTPDGFREFAQPVLRKRSTRYPCGPSTSSRRSCLASCERQRLMNMPVRGFAGIGRLASVPVRMYS